MKKTLSSVTDVSGLIYRLVEQGSAQESLEKKLPYLVEIFKRCKFLPNIPFTNCLLDSVLESLEKEYRDFQRGEILGSGTYGTVYRLESESEKEFVVKTENKKGRLKREVRALTILKTLMEPEKEYPILMMREFFSSNGFNSIIFPKLEYNLFHYLYQVKNREVPIGEIARIVLNLTDALTFIRPFLIHADLKLENVLLDGPERVKLADFGISLFPLDSKGEYKNDPSYMVCVLEYRPPEVMSADVDTYTAQLDLWSLGCMLYELTYGSRLFKFGKKDLNLSTSQLRLRYDDVVRRDSEKLVQKKMKTEEDKMLLSLIKGLLNEDPKKRISLEVVSKGLEKLFDPEDPVDP